MQIGEPSSKPVAHASTRSTAPCSAATPPPTAPWWTSPNSDSSPSPGPRSLDFLQGQVSNDLRELSDAHSQLSSHCTAKGRMLANFRVLRIEDSIFLVLPRDPATGPAQRLRMFVLRAKVQVEDASDALVCAGVIGDCADDLLSATFGSLPADANSLARHQAMTLIRVAGPTQRRLLIGPAEQVKAVWEAASAQAAEADPGLWGLHDIRAGIPVIRPETSDAFVPQMTNMQLIDGVSFHKGCYTGQEVVARMQYLGKLKRRMYHASVETDTAPRAGDPLLITGSRSEQASDRIVDARQVAPGRWELLVVVETVAAEGGEVRLGADGPALTLTPPPYGFPGHPGGRMGRRPAVTAAHHAKPTPAAPEDRALGYQVTDAQRDVLRQTSARSRARKALARPTFQARPVHPINKPRFDPARLNARARNARPGLRTYLVVLRGWRARPRL